MLKESPFSFALTGANGFAVRVLRWESPELARCLWEGLWGWGRGVMVRRCSQGHERDSTECAPGFGSGEMDWKKGKRRTPETFYKR